VTRSGSLKRLALFGAWTLAGVGLFYVPTLLGGSPWSWHVADLDVRLLMGLSCWAGLLLGHWFWPTTKQWPELEREVARLLALNIDQTYSYVDKRWHDHLKALVRPHVLERERR